LEWQGLFDGRLSQETGEGIWCSVLKVQWYIYFKALFVELQIGFLFYRKFCRKYIFLMRNHFICDILFYVIQML